MKIASRIFDNGEVYTVGDSLVITRKAEPGFVSGVIDNGSRLPRFYGKLEFEYLLGISEEFSINTIGTPKTCGFSLVFKNPRHTGVSAEDFVYPAIDPQADAEWRAKQPNLSEFMNGTAPVLANRNFRETIKMRQVSQLVREVFEGETIEDFGLLQEDQDDDATVKWVLPTNATREFPFRGRKFEGFRALVDVADYIQISLERTDGYLFSLTFGVYDVRF